MVKIGIIFVMSALIIGVQAQAEIYKWKDDKGKIHYGDKPVDSGEQMDIQEEPVTKKNMSSSEREDRRQKLLETFGAERKEKKEQQAKQQKKKARLNAQCGSSKDRLRRYKKAGSLYDVDKDGNRKTLSDDVRNSAIRKLQRQIKKYCK